MDFGSDKFFTAVTDELVHSTVLTNFILEGVDELRIIFEKVAGGEFGTSANENDTLFGPTVGSWSVGVDDVTGNRFIAPREVASRKPCAEVDTEVVVTLLLASVLCSMFKGGLNNVNGNKGKVGTVMFVVGVPLSSDVGGNDEVV